MQKMIILFVASVLFACTSAKPALSAQYVIDQFKAQGLEVSDPKPEVATDFMPVGYKSFSDQLNFSIAEVGKGGNQVFVCKTRKDCDVVYDYFYSLKALAGPYLYRSPDGLVVVQLFKGLKPETAAKFQKVVESL